MQLLDANVAVGAGLALAHWCLLVIFHPQRPTATLLRYVLVPEIHVVAQPVYRNTRERILGGLGIFH